MMDTHKMPDHGEADGKEENGLKYSRLDTACNNIRPIRI